MQLHRVKELDMLDNIINELPENGRGLKLMSDVADELLYTRAEGQRNCLSLIKRYEGNSESGNLLKSARLQVNTNLDALPQVLDWYEELQSSIPPEIFHYYQLALAEGFTNAVRHAHKDLPADTPIEIEFKVYEGRLEMRLWDCGKPFDLNAKLSELKAREENNYQQISLATKNF